MPKKKPASTRDLIPRFKKASQAQIALADATLEATDDGTIELVDGSEIALKIEHMLDEYQDVATGVDEDAAKAATAEG